MKMNKTALNVALATAMLAGPAVAMAYEQGDWIIRGGLANVNPDASSDAISIPTSPPTVFENGVDVKDDTQIFVTGTYMFADNWGVEVLASTPFEHDIVLNDAPVDAGSTKHLPPTVVVNWYPRGGQEGWQPYIGAGLNYTFFWDEQVDSQLEGALGDIVGNDGPLPADLSLDDSWGLALRAGVDIPINDNWAVSASMYWIDIDTSATVSTAVADVDFDVEIDPFVYMLGVAYKF
ncbi:MAG: outer membrane beta-barrel protein [Gammaproteobacteria bacterium]|jgi:outer membrane protein|nr:outer membrane beta-barrel protein [Gammaproteobacteria bacterium]